MGSDIGVGSKLSRGGSVEDPEGFARRFDAHRPRLLRECSALLEDANLAQDVVQETFLRAQRSLHRFDDSRPLLPWLIVITRRLCFDHLRRESSRRSVPFDVVAERGPEWGRADDGTWKQVRRGAIRGALHRAFSRLSQRQQRMLSLAVIEGYSYAEVAEACGTSEKAVKSALCRARERLRLEFRRMGEDGLLGVAGWPIVRPLTSWWRRLRSQVHTLHGSMFGAVEGQVGALLVAAVVVATSMAASGQGVRPESSLSPRGPTGAVVSIEPDDPHAAPSASAPAPSSEASEAVDAPLLEAREEAGSPEDEIAVAVEASIQGGERPTVHARDENRAGDEDGEGDARVRLYCDRGSSLRKSACEAANSALDRAPID